LNDSGTKDRSHLPTLAAAAISLLATTVGTKAADGGQTTVLPPAVSKRHNENERIPVLVLTPPNAGILIAYH
jgi:hypothetical protein